MPALEMSFDGLIGPTHNYAGLSHGNVASRRNEGQASSPRGAVLEGLEKMAFVASLGVPQGILPPHERPRLDLLRSLGFTGDDAAVLSRAHAEAPALLAAAWSASPMWAANAATVTPSADSADGRVHLTPANLVTTLHRSIEHVSTEAALRRVFPTERFAIHPALPGTPVLGDEGAANHTRLHPGGEVGGVGLSLFVYGKRGLGGGTSPARFPARQTREASEAIARRHGVLHSVFVQQRTSAIDAGVFHNDVICVGHEDALLWHEEAFEDATALDEIRSALEELGGTLRSWRVGSDELGVDEAVRSYLFNSQLLTTPDGLVLVAPTEVEESEAARAVAERLVSEGALHAARYLDVRQSMRNGGGPACLRLRVALTDEERADVLPGCVFDAERHAALRAWAEAHYRGSLSPEDLADPALVRESHEALDALTSILGLGSDFYGFQRG